MFDLQVRLYKIKEKSNFTPFAAGKCTRHGIMASSAHTKPLGVKTAPLKFLLASSSSLFAALLLPSGPVLVAEAKLNPSCFSALQFPKFPITSEEKRSESFVTDFNLLKDYLTADMKADNLSFSFENG